MNPNPYMYNTFINKNSLSNLLNTNIGKKVSIYTTFKDSIDFRDVEFNGIIEQISEKYILLSNPETGKWYLIPVEYINYIKFDENINYNKIMPN